MPAEASARSPSAQRTTPTRSSTRSRSTCRSSSLPSSAGATGSRARTSRPKCRSRERARSASGQVRPQAEHPVQNAGPEGSRRISVVEGDITRLEVDAIANAANTDLKHGGGVAGAISRAGGPAVQRKSDSVAPIELGEAVETTAGEMPCRWVIHAATMELGGPTSAEIIRDATVSTLRKADELGARSLALVAFGTGVGGFPVEEAARIEIDEVSRYLGAGGSAIERVVF